MGVCFSNILIFLSFFALRVCSIAISIIEEDYRWFNPATTHCFPTMVLLLRPISVSNVTANREQQCLQFYLSINTLYVIGGWQSETPVNGGMEWIRSIRSITQYAPVEAICDLDLGRCVKWWSKRMFHLVWLPSRKGMCNCGRPLFYAWVELAMLLEVGKDGSRSWYSVYPEWRRKC